MTFNIMNLSFFIILYEPSTSFASSSNGCSSFAWVQYKHQKYRFSKLIHEIVYTYLTADKYWNVNNSTQQKKEPENPVSFFDIASFYDKYILTASYK